MIKRTIRQFDINHTGDEEDRLEILAAFRSLAEIIGDAHLAEVSVESVKSNLITVTIEEVDAY